MMERKIIHERVLQAASTEELMNVYKIWAKRYDSDLMKEMGYRAPARTVDIFSRYLNGTNPHILDAGCGTGIIGTFLTQMGFAQIDGLDYSADMLEEARAKGVYSKLLRADLTRQLDIETDSYDAVISVGTFTLGHVGPEALPELIRITKPGGVICFTVRDTAWKKYNYRKKTMELEARNLWRLEELHTADYIEEEGSMCKIPVYTVP